ncbi:eukaryotic translation initiation factor 5B [Onthophagus taurus]|uniref:eukaryotic translation initiation factor 5B n=1 Tax=Onthophagus taurus TaxID=166361 RepID=UPI0039BDD0E0
MGKAKKGRKGAKGDESDSDVEVEATDIIGKDPTKKTKANKQKQGKEQDEGNENKSNKGKKEKSHDSDDEVPKADKQKQDEGNENKSNKGKKEKSHDSDDEVPKVAQKFALLEVESGPEVESDQAESDNETKKVTKKPEKGRKGKKDRKKKAESDEDIDKVLAELEMEYSGGKKEEKVEEKPIVEEKKVENVKKLEKQISVEEENKEDVQEGTVKTAAQKKKEKKEREKQKKLAIKKSGNEKKESTPQPSETEKPELTESKPEEKGDEDAEDKTEKDGKKKKKKGKETVAAGKEDAKKGPGKKTIAAMQEALKKLREEEERLKKEQEERIRREEEAEQARLEQLRLEQEKKDRKKKKEKERKERLKAEGKLLTNKQKADRARAQAMIDSLKAQGVELPDVGERKPRPGTRIRPKKMDKDKEQTPDGEGEIKDEGENQEIKEELETVGTTEKKEGEIEPDTPEDDVKDAWDADSSEDEGSEEVSEQKHEKNEFESKHEKDDEESSSEDDDDDEEDETDSDSDDSEVEDEHLTDAEKRRAKALARIEERKLEAEKNKTIENLRAAIVCVLGHVDTGKTKILDKLRRTNVQDGEAGGITQQIGATNVPIENIKENIRFVKGAPEMQLKLPGLLIIDTPGHESFSNLRNRGSSLCDIAILVVDIMHGLEPQTIESINLLKSKKTPFVVALNKIDRLYDWQTLNRKDVRDIIKAQAANTQLEFEERTKQVTLQFAEQGLNASLFYDNPDIRSYVSLVPTSAVTGEGMGNLLALIVEYSQNMLAKRLMYSDELQATVLEVKAIPGLGTTIDVILVNGTLREGDSMVLAGTDGPIVTQIRSLLMPQPMKELRVKNAYIEYKSVKAAQGVKIAAKELEKAIAGLNLYVAHKSDEVDIVKEEVARELKSALSSIKLQERGVYVQASTLGSLEALLEFLRTSKIPYSGIRIGPVVKKDVMKASIMLEHESQYATILAFDVKIERDAQELADNLGVKIFQADIIYHLFDKFIAYRDELKQKKREEFKNIAVFPCKLRVLPQFIFNSRDPIVMGVMVEAGIVKEGTPICVPSKEFVDLGIVTSIENNHKAVESARKGMEVCIKIEPIPGESPKMFGRHFDDKDFLISKISRQSIDACKDYFRDDLVKTDWQLMVELKKIFQIL